METKIDTIKPNLYVFNDNNICFGINNSDVIPVSMSIDKVVNEHIGKLKVKKADLETIKFGKGKSNEIYSIPLKKYLDALKEKGVNCTIHNEAVKLFNLKFNLNVGYLIDAQTVEDIEQIHQWVGLSNHLTEPDKYFDKCEENYLIRIDKEKTSEKIKEIMEELTPKIPNNAAYFTMIKGLVPSAEQRGNFGRITLNQLKAKDNAEIERTKDELIEKLKKINGPYLSLDAPSIFNQVIYFNSNAPELLNKCGDIFNRDIPWQNRLFRIDP